MSVIKPLPVAPADHERGMAKKDCLCEYCSGLRRHRKMRDIAKQRGRAALVRMPEAQAAFDLVRDLHDAGTAFSSMAGQTGIAQSKFTEIYKGYKTLGGGRRRLLQGMRRETFNAIMALKAESSPMARMDPTGTVRRMRALLAIGCTPRLIAELAGESTSFGYVSRITGTGLDFVTAQFHDRIALAYDKLAYGDPADWGIQQFSITRSKRHAAKRGWAPPHCWDDDTIDDPLAAPEWTGECGTYDGYLLHRKHKITMCEPCLLASADPGRVEERKRRWKAATCVSEIHGFVAEFPGCTARDIREALPHRVSATVDRTVKRLRNEGELKVVKDPTGGERHRHYIPEVV